MKRILESLSAGFSAELGTPIRFEPHLNRAESASGQVWCEPRSLGGWCVPRPSPQVRSFLRDHFRYTRSRWRQIPQFALGTLLGTEPAISNWGRRRAVALPGLPDAEDRLILPGSRRIRSFDFKRGRSRVWVLAGCSAETTLREMTLRGSRPGPFPPLTAKDPDAGWYEEPILEGWCLARLPPWKSRRNVLTAALEALDRFTLPERSELVPADWAQVRYEFIAARLPDRARLLDGRALSCLAELASEGDRIAGTLAHGDLQEGNVFVERSGRVNLLDWEFSHPTFAEYDRLVLGLGMRAGRDVYARLAAFLRGENQHVALHGLPQPWRERRRLVARLLLEDLQFFLLESEAREDGYSEGLGTLLRTAQRMGETLAQRRP